MFTRGASAGQLWYVDVASGATRQVPTPLGGSDPGLVAAARLSTLNETEAMEE